MSTSDSATYALMSCLDKGSQIIVKNIDDNLDEMWKRLDENYGQPSKLADIIMREIKKLRVVKEGDDKKFVQLVDMVEAGYRDLERAGIKREISNNATISLIEERLPKDIKREWARRVKGKDSIIDDSNKFENFLEFLLEEKRVIAYEPADLRTVSYGASR